VSLTAYKSRRNTFIKDPYLYAHYKLSIEEVAVILMLKIITAIPSRFCLLILPELI